MLGPWGVPGGGRSTPASSAMEKEKVRSPGGGSTASQACQAHAAGDGRLHTCATVPSLAPPARLRHKVQVRHPAHLPATPAPLDTKDGADPMSDKAFLGSSGKPLRMEREGETEKQHDSSETGAVRDTGRVTPAQQTGQRQGSCLAPLTWKRRNRATGQTGTRRALLGSAPRSQVPARSDNRIQQHGSSCSVSPRCQELDALARQDRAHRDSETKTPTRFHCKGQRGDLHRDFSGRRVSS